MTIDRKQAGAVGERIAREYMEKLGYRIIETNFRCRDGEIDSVAEKGGQIVFVEVRTKRSTEFGTPEESITTAKREKLIQVATTYLQTYQALSQSWRIDVVAVELGPGDVPSRVELIENAVAEES